MAKTMRDIYALTFEILDLKKELVAMKKDYAVKKTRLEKLLKEEAEIVKQANKK